MQEAQVSDPEAGSGPRSAGVAMLSIAREGVTSGVLGASAVAIWFLITDTIAGTPFHTPALLGARLFRGTASENLQGLPGSPVALVAGYTLVHGLAFVVAGLLIACAMELFERTPPLLIPGFFFLVVFLEFVYYTYVLAFVEPVMASVDWFAVFVGNLIAVASMVGYFWLRHRDLPRKLLAG